MVNRSLLISLGLWTSLSLAGCMNRAPSLRMLHERADYDGKRIAELTPPELREGGVEGFKNAPVPVRTRPKVAAIYIHPHEMASRDYFWGGWISVVIEKDQWILTQPGQMPKAQGIGEIKQ